MKNPLRDKVLRKYYQNEYSNNNKMYKLIVKNLGNSTTW